METLLADILSQCRDQIAKGKVASYIPQLAKADPEKFGICVVDEAGNLHTSGAAKQKFALQSIVKPIILLTALWDSGEDKVRALAGVEATGKPFDTFNYSDRALSAEHINPMINTGAIAMCTLISGKDYEEKFRRLLGMVRYLSGNPSLDVDQAVYLSEKETGHKNRALAYLLKAYGLIDDAIEPLVDCYFKACSIAADCTDLAKIAYVFAYGRSPDGQVMVAPAYVRYVNATLMTCGMYDGSGEFALNVGFPAKSGVGGGILGVVPRRMGIGVYNPALDPKGNSIAGIKALTLLSEQQNLSIF